MAVAHELKQLSPECHLVCVSERGGKFQHLIDAENAIDEKYYISAGKYRRYHGQSWYRKLLDVKTLALNIRDFFRFLIGCIQSRRLLRKVRPDLVFIKGGFVGLPIGLAAAKKKIPIVTHDSDTIPGLANRIVSRWASLHATGMPPELYAYPIDKTRYTGVPVSANYGFVDSEAKSSARKHLGIPKDALLIFITGGSQGAREMNQTIASVYDKILGLSDKILVIHQVGQGKRIESAPKRVTQYEFISEMYKYSAAADIVICRPGASTMTELALQAKPTVIVPAVHLAGGHQVKNADYLKRNNAALVASESNGEELVEAVQSIVNDEALRQKLANNLHSLFKVNAASDIANLLLEEVNRQNVST